MRYLLQWVLFIVFCGGAIWYFVADEKPWVAGDSEKQITKQSTPAISEPEPDQIKKTEVVSPPVPSPVPESVSSTDNDIAANQFEVTGLLLDGKYDEAIDLYATRYSREPESSTEPLRNAILQFAENLIIHEVYEDAAKLLATYTEIFYRDVDALLLQAEAYRGTDQTNEIVTMLQLALREIIDPEQRKRVRKQLDIAVSRNADEILKTQSQQAVVEYYDGLLADEPGHAHYLFGKAMALSSLQQWKQALNVIDQIPSSDRWNEIEQLETSLQQKVADAARTSIKIPIQAVGENYTVEVVINDGPSLNLLIDTGASMTAIDPAALNKIGISHNTTRYQEFQTANGTIRAPVIKLASLTLGGHKLSDIDIGGLRLGDVSDVDGLLGMDVLNQFEFTILQKEYLLELRR